MHEDRRDNENFSVKLDSDRVWFLGGSIVTRHTDQLMEVREVALWRWGHVKGTDHGKMSNDAG